MSDEQSEHANDQIHELDERTIERIAAGEVVERPASVVKELVENSLDADASRVTVAVESGGTESIRVSDDGIGMTETDAKRAGEKHTTSKIGDIDDIEAGVRTLGFRGEALSAIGAVSRMTITTKPRGERGTEVCIDGGERTHVGPAGCPEGTTVEVTDLFHNVPARRKYLKRESTEFDHIQRIVMGYALANPDVSVTLEHDERERFSTSGRGDLQSTIMAVYGREVASAMVSLDFNSDSKELPDGPLSSITGLVSHPETNRASRDYCTTFVNGRYVTARAVRESVVEAYGTQLAPDRYPFAVVFLELDPATVDVNVHPRKLEVRFANEESARKQVNHAVKDALLREGLIRSNAPRGQSAPEQTEITPGDEDREETEENIDISENVVKEFDKRPEMSDDADGVVEERETENATGKREKATDTRSEQRQRDTSDESAESIQSEGGATTDSSNGSPYNEQTVGEDTVSDNRTDADTDTTTTDPHDRSERRIQGPTTQTRLSDDDPEPAQLDQLPSLRVFGQLHDTYLVCETDDGLVLIDQHAADERINYERLKRRFEEDVTTQALAEPVRLELTAREAALFEDYTDSLAQLGFHASLAEERTAEVRTVPGLLAESVGPSIIRDLLTAFVDGDGASTVEAAADDLLADLACYPSITGNTSLTEGSVIDLLRALDECENPYACPHGRPVIIEINQRELENRFERDYPGHEGR
jgi:DNA mismatch repair protein MutL